MSFAKAAAILLVVVMALSFLFVRYADSTTGPPVPSVGLTQEAANRECGGEAVLKNRAEETGDGGLANVREYDCPDGRRISATL